MAQNDSVSYPLDQDQLRQGFDGQDRIPSSSNDLEAQDQTSSFDDDSLIELHKIYGNKWKKISKHFSLKNDSFIKNHFYSLLRRSLRKINSFIKSKNKLQNNKYKLLKLNFVFKLTNLAESERNGFSNKKVYTNLLYKFLELKNLTLNKSGIQEESQLASYFNMFSDQRIEDLISALREIECFFLQHNLNKKGKSKKKCPKKLFLKKDKIQQSISLKQSCQNQKNFQCRTPENWGQFHVQNLMEEEEDQLRNFDLEDVCHNTTMSILPLQSWFDPLLFR